jgi:hypothetical protein
MINYTALAVALLLSVIAGYFSVIGLATIFTGAFVSVLIMGGTLEVAKVVTVGWLTRNWSECPKAIKIYLCGAVAILMIITSMGTFGYLSKAHLETSTTLQISQLQADPLQMQLELAERKLQNAQTSLDSLDRIVAGSDVDQASKLVVQQRNTRRNLEATISSASREIQDINTKLLPLKSAQASTEAEIGPLTYIAELIYGSDAKDHFDTAVRFVIIIIVLVFDPLAIVLLIAANHGLKPKSRFRYDKATGKLVMK